MVLEGALLLLFAYAIYLAAEGFEVSDGEGREGREGGGEGKGERGEGGRVVEVLLL